MATKQPLSIDALLQKQREEKEALAKPTFLTKAQREAQALEKRAADVKAQEAKQHKAKQERTLLEQAARRSAPAPSGSRDAFRSTEGRYDDHRDAPNGPRGVRGRGRGARGGGRYDDRRRDDRRFDDRRDERNGTMPPPAPLPAVNGHSNGTAAPAAAHNEPFIDRAALEARYLGGPPKKKPRKQSDKKFTFDWEKTDDTGADEIDPLYKHNRPAYGAVRLAGVDSSLHAERPVAKVLATADPDDAPLAGPAHMERKSGRAGFMDERHWSDKKLTEMKERDWRIFREDFNIAARGGQIPMPMRFWNESKIPPTILDIIEQIGYKEPSPIQRIAIPLGLQNRDTIGIAETGSGKTAAFLIPMLHYITKLPPLTDENRHRGPYGLVMAPTRELAQQIEQEAIKFTLGLGFKCVSIVGGKSMEGQQFDLRHGCEILIATPGRLKDCIERSVIVLSQCSYVVMDEADRMVSLGFEDVINFILDSLPVSNVKPDTDEAMDADKMVNPIIDMAGQRQLYRQTFMFSATMPPAVERLAKSYMRRPAIVTIGVAGQAVDTVEQRVEFFSGEEQKKSRLLDILANDGFTPPIIVFVNQKKGADVLARDLQRARWSVTTLHSDKNQEQREAALASLRTGAVDILVATDLASRGIDVPDVSLVLNFQMSSTIEAYVHRIGRSGRAGKTGTAITFLVDKDDSDIMYDLKAEIQKSPISKCPPELLKHPSAQSKMTGAMKRRAEEFAEA